MTYSTVLRFFVPEERGDFFYRYRINGRQYVIYSPEKDVISCLELFSFRDLAPIELASLIGSESTINKIEEFYFSKICTKERIVSYLFDIRESSNNFVLGHVSNMQGYLLYDIINPSKVRNVYLFHNESSEFELLFDNDICCTEIHSHANSESINLCWSPIIFKEIEDRVGEDSWSYLLPSNNKILYFSILQQGIDHNFSYYLHTENDSINALLFIGSYLENFSEGPKISIDSDNKMVYVHLISWSSPKVMNFVSKIQKRCTSDLRKCFELEEGLSNNYFQCKLIGNDSFIIFPNIELCSGAVCKELINSFSLNNIHLVSNRDGQADKC